MPDFSSMLSGGRANSLGRTEEVVSLVLEDRRRLPALFAALDTDDELVRLRVGDALEKICRVHPEWFDAHFDAVLEMGRTGQASLEWHTAQILTAMDLAPPRRRRAINWLWRTLDQTDDWIVISETLTALAAFAPASPAIQAKLPKALARYRRDRRPAVAKRAAKLEAKLRAA